MTDYYSAPSGYLENPANALYHIDCEIGDDAISEMIDYVGRLENSIRGDFNLEEMTISIKRKFLNFVEIGCLAFKIKSLCIWKEDKTLCSFKDYCLKVLKRPAWQVNKYIKAARVMIDLIVAGFEQLPQSMSQALELANFKGGELLDKWEECLKNIPDQMRSARGIKELLNPTPEEKQKEMIKLPKRLSEKLKRKAAQLGLSPDELLEELLADDDRVSEVDPQKIEAWETDIQQLIDEHEQEISQDESEEITSDSHVNFEAFNSSVDEPRSLFNSLFIYTYLQLIGKFQVRDDE